MHYLQLQGNYESIYTVAAELGIPQGKTLTIDAIH
jgi:hypothetical protein